MGATGHDESVARERGVAHPRGSAGGTRVERPRPAPAPPPGARGSHFLRFTREGHAQARPLFERAMELDPNYAEAYALLEVSYGVEYQFGWNLDPNLSSVTITLAGRTIFGANVERRRGRRSATMRSASSRLS